MKIGDLVLWIAADQTPRIGRVCKLIRSQGGPELAECTTDTFGWDPEKLVSIELERLMTPEQVRSLVRALDGMTVP